MSNEAILSLFKSFHEHHSLKYDLISVNTTPSTQLVYELYEAYYEHVFQKQTKSVVTPDSKQKSAKTLSSVQSSSSSKKRRVSKVPKDDTHMGNQNFPLKDPHTGTPLAEYVHRIFALTSNMIRTMTKPEVTKYLKAYATQYELDTQETYYTKTAISEMRDQLLQAAVELHAFCTPRTVSNLTTDSTISTLERIIVYKELFQYKLQKDQKYDISNILLLKCEVARKNS